MNNQNLAQDLTKKKPEARLSDFLVQNILVELNMYLNLAHQTGKKKPES